MNSLLDNKYDEQLDQLLLSSVSPGAEPIGFKVGPMPDRPVFCWSCLVYSLIGVGIAGYFPARWLMNLDYNAVDYSDWITVEVFNELIGNVTQESWIILISLAVAVLVFLPEKLRTLCRSF